MNAIALALIVLRVPGSYVWWSLYGLGAAVNVLGFSVLSAGFPKDMTARASTALNLLMFVGSFAAQWGIGVIVESVRNHLQFSVAGGLKLAFATVLVLDAIALGWFARGWRIYATDAAEAGG